MNETMVAWAFVQGLRAPEKPVLIAVSASADADGVCEAPMEVLANLCGYQERALRDALMALRALGYLRVETRRPLPSRLTILLEPEELEAIRAGAPTNRRETPGSWRAAPTNRHETPVEPARDAGLNRHVAPVNRHETPVEPACGAGLNRHETPVIRHVAPVHRERAELEQQQEQRTPPSTSPQPRPLDVPDGHDLGTLEQIASMAGNRDRRRNGMMLNAIAANRLRELFERHGGPAVREALLRCGDADMPVERAAAILEPPQGRGGGRRGGRQTDPVPGRSVWGG